MAVLIPSIGSIFLLSPGTGSTSLSAWFIEHMEAEWIFPGRKKKHATPQEITRLGIDLSRYIVLTTTRNPFDFYISQYHKKRTWKGTSPEFQLAKENPFPVFLRRFLDETPDGILHPSYLNAADVVLRRECLEDDLNAFLRHLQINKQARLPQLNVSENLSHTLQDWYSPTDLQRVERKHQEHLSRFGYHSASYEPSERLELPRDLLTPSTNAEATDTSEFVLAGRDGWLFLGDASNDILKCTTGTYDERAQWLKSWQAEITARTQAATSARYGSATYIVPNTHSALPMHLPDEVSLAAERPVTWLTETFPQIHYPLHLLQDQSCFARNDSHYSEYGAYRLYDYICRQHGLTPQDIPDEAFALQRYIGDLGAKLFPARSSLQLYLTDSAKEALGLNKVQQTFHSSVNVTGRFEIRSNPQALNPETVLVYGDSYSYRLLPLLSLNFRHVVFLHCTCPPLELIAASGADLVLFVHAERFITQRPQRHPGGHREEYRAKLEAMRAAHLHAEPPHYEIEEVAELGWLIEEIVALEKLYDEHYPNKRLNFGKLAQLGRLLLHRDLGHAELLDKRRRHPSLQSALLEMVNSEEFALKNGKPGHINP